ncbi:MAG TPA: efflux RND transporter periplasmic adaptor subunit [Caulobacteraceae bacterium]|nr:efflux RND transporter periplasmic adaptor subunit [Caulobacteraceae bacterium]
MAAKPNARRWIVIGAAGLGALLLVALFIPRPVQVDAASVVRGPIAEAVYDQGQARVRDAYVAAAPVGGALQRISLKVGDRVTPGEVVARIAPASAPLLDPSVRAQREAAVAAAAADFKKADAERVRTALVLERTRPLIGVGASSRQSLDDAKAAADQAAQAARSAAQALAEARAALIGPDARGGQLVDVTSPAAGWVTRVMEPSARTVTAGTQLIEVSAGQGLEAVVEFLSEDAAKIRPGMAAEVYDWGGAPLAARVRLVEPSGFTKVSALGVDEQRVYVWLTIADAPANWAALAPGYRIWGRVFLRQSSHALIVPLGALQRHAGGWALYRIVGGRARLTPVSIGAITDKDAEALSGVSEGDQVVIFPSDQVKDGVGVSARKP